MNKDTANQYYAMLEKYECGEITQQQWFAYCAMVLEVLMEENKDVFIRLKNR
jgi:hypothetical protein